MHLVVGETECLDVAEEVVGLYVLVGLVVVWTGRLDVLMTGLDVE